MRLYIPARSGSSGRGRGGGRGGGRRSTPPTPRVPSPAVSQAPGEGERVKWVGGLSSAHFTKPGSSMYGVDPLGSSGELGIELTDSSRSHLFRHASEITRETKGGYLQVSV